MSEVTLDTDALYYLTLFEKVCRVQAKDILVLENRLMIVIPETSTKKAIGRNSQNLLTFAEKVGRDITMIEYSDDPVQFMTNLFSRFGVEEAKLKTIPEGLVAFVKVNPDEKKKAIGKAGWNLRASRELAKRHHAIANVFVN